MAKAKTTVVEAAEGERVMHPGCADEVAAWLASHGVKHSKLVAIPLTNINERESRANQARREALDAETVDRYAQAEKRGERLPPVVARVIGNGPKVALIDGNHREAGTRRARVRDHVLGYVVADDTPTAVLKLLTVEANSRHGLRVDTAWKHAQAAMLHAEGFGVDIVAAALAVTETWVKDSLRVSQADDRAAELKIRGWSDLPVTTRQVVMSVQSDPVFAELARLVIDTEMGSGKGMTDLVRNIRAQRSEADQLTYIGSVYEERAAGKKMRERQGRGTRLPSYRQQVVSALGAVCALDAGRVPATFTTPAEMDELHSRCEAAAERVFEIMETLSRRKLELSA